MALYCLSRGFPHMELGLCPRCGSSYLVIYEWEKNNSGRPVSVPSFIDGLGIGSGRFITREIMKAVPNCPLVSKDEDSPCAECIMA